MVAADKKTTGFGEVAKVAKVTKAAKAAKAATSILLADLGAVGFVDTTEAVSGKLKPVA